MRVNTDIYPKSIFIAFLVLITIYVWRPSILNGIPLYQVIFPICFTCLLCSKQINSKMIGRNLRKSTYCWLIVLLWGIASLLWIKLTGNELTIIAYLFNWILISIIFSVYSCNKFFREKILKYYCIFAAIIGVMGLITSITGYYFHNTYDSYYYTRNFLNLYRPNSIFYNVNDHAVFMFFSIVVLFLATERSKTSFWRVTGMLLFCANIILVDSRGAELAVMMFLAIYFFKEKKLKWYHKVLIVFIIAMFVLFNYNLIFSMGLLNVGLGDSGRLFIIGMSLSSLKQSYFMGVGPGNIAAVNEALFSSPVVAPHNFFLEILCDYGIVGFISIVVWFLNNLMCSWKLSRYDRGAFIVWIALIAFLPISIVSSSLIGKSWFACFFGILIAYLNSTEYSIRQSNQGGSKRYLIST